MTGRRIVVTGHQQLAVEPFEVPESLARGEVLIAVEASLISPGTELSGFRGRVNSPYTPGYTAVGRVAAVGERSDENLLGRRVFIFPEQHDSSGCHASHKLLRAGGLMLPVDDLEPGAACFLRLINIALTPFCCAGPALGGPVAVIGLGLVGHFLVLVALAQGRRAIGIDPDPARRARAVAAGAELVIDPAATDPVTAVLEATAGGAALTVDSTGRCDTFPAAVQMTRSGGEASTLGGVKVSHTCDLLPMLSKVQWEHVTIRGGWEMLLPRRRSAAGGPSTEDNLERGRDWLRSGRVNLHHAWTHTIGPEQFGAAYQALLAQDPGWLGVVVEWGG